MSRYFGIIYSVPLHLAKVYLPCPLERGLAQGDEDMKVGPGPPRPEEPFKPPSAGGVDDPSPRPSDSFSPPGDGCPPEQERPGSSGTTTPVPGCGEPSAGSPARPAALSTGVGAPGPPVAGGAPAPEGLRYGELYAKAREEGYVGRK